MGEQIRISDLRHPVLTDAQRAVLEAGERTAVELSPEAVLRTAVERTGLDDFGPEDFIERLGLWLEEVDQDPVRTGLGRHAAFENGLRYAVNRLRVGDLLRRHPEIRELSVTAPIVVVGLPRSGTTHLVNLLAADPRLRSLPRWESIEPVPDPSERPGPDGLDPRYGRAAAEWESMRSLLPHMAAMHPVTPDHIHEELELMQPDFSSYSLEWKSRCPRWRDYYLSHDQTPHYRYMKDVLRILQWYHPGERWVLKCPQHLEQLGPLLSVFPDATVVVTHRDPVSVVQSAATMLCYVARMNYRSTDPEFYVDYWTDRVRRLLEASIRDRPLLERARAMDVSFDDIVADEMGVVERIYHLAGLALTPPARAAIEQYVATHQRGRDGQIVYDLRRDFDVDPTDVRRHFGFYLDRFPVRAEVA